MYKVKARDCGGWSSETGLETGSCFTGVAERGPVLSHAFEVSTKYMSSP